MMIYFAIVIAALLGVVAYLQLVFLPKRQASGKKSDEAKLKQAMDNRRLDYRYAEDAPFFFIKGESVWTGVICESTTDEFDIPAEQEARVERNTRLQQAILSYFQSIHGDEFQVPCHERILYHPVDVSGWRDGLDSNSWQPSSLFNTLIDVHVSPHISKSTPERRRVLLIRLGDFKGVTQIDPVSAALSRVDHVAEELFNSADLAKFREQAADLQRRLHSYGAEPMRRADLSWLMRKTLSGHFEPETDRDYDLTRPWRGGRFDLMVNFHGQNLKYAVEVEEPNPEGETPRKSYTTTLVVADAPAVQPFQYAAAWGRVLRSLPYPVSISRRYTLISQAQWRKMLTPKITKIRDEAEDRAKVGHTDDPAFSAVLEEANMLRDELATDPQPAIIDQLRLSISTPTLQELKRAVQDVQSIMGDFKMAQPRRVQAALLEEQLPGDMRPLLVGKWSMSNDTKGIDLGTRYSDLNALGLARLDSSPTVGDDTERWLDHTLGWHGPLIGYSQENGALVHFDPHVQVARNAGAGVAIVGQSGGGKSSLALMLFFWMSESGTQVVAADPKNDFEKFCYYLAFGSQVADPDFAEEAAEGILGSKKSKFTPVNQEFWDETEIVDLFKGKAGMLDAWSLTQDYEAGELLARSQLELLLPDPEDRKLLNSPFGRMKKAYYKSLDTGKNYIPTLSKLINELASEIETLTEDYKDTANEFEARKNASLLQDVHDRLERASRSPYSRLLFGSGNEKVGFASLNRRRTVITLFGFRAPTDPDPMKWGEAERNAAAAMFTALHRIEGFFSDVKESVSPNHHRRGIRPRALFVDEGYMIASIEAGRSLLSRALRQGRSLNFVVIFISQQAGDIAMLEKEAAAGDESAAEMNQFGTVFTFMQKTEDEAMSALSVLRTGSSDSGEDRKQLARKLLSSNVGGELSTGVCAMKDMSGRIGIVRVDPLFAEFFAASQTNAMMKSEMQAVDLPEDGADWTVNTTARDITRTGILFTTVEEGRKVAAHEEFEFAEYSHLIGA